MLTDTLTYIRSYILAYMLTCMTRTCNRIYMLTSAGSDIQVHIHAYILAYIHTHIHADTYIHTHIHSYVYMHANIHLYMQTCMAHMAISHDTYTHNIAS